jgi:hypothetical protein
VNERVDGNADRILWLVLQTTAKGPVQFPARLKFSVPHTFQWRRTCRVRSQTKKDTHPIAATTEATGQAE